MAFWSACAGWASIGLRGRSFRPIAWSCIALRRAVSSTAAMRIIASAARSNLSSSARKESPKDACRAMPLGACSLCPEKESKSTCRYSCREIDPHLADRLRGVAMEDDRGIGFLGQPGELLDGKDDARLVVGVHDAHQQRLGAQGADELADIEIAVAVDVQPGDAAAVALRGPCRPPARPGARPTW